MSRKLIFLFPSGVQDTAPRRIKNVYVSDNFFLYKRIVRPSVKLHKSALELRLWRLIMPGKLQNSTSEAAPLEAMNKRPVEFTTPTRLVFTASLSGKLLL